MNIILLALSYLCLISVAYGYRHGHRRRYRRQFNSRPEFRHHRRDIPHRRSYRSAEDIPSVQQRIAGGRDAFPGEIPYQVYVTFFEDYLCGGAIVKGPQGNQMIITAAQCVTTDIPEHNGIWKTIFMNVWAGAIDRNKNESFHQERGVRRIVRHEGYRAGGKHLYNDIAIIHLKKDFEETRYVKPIELPTTEGIYPPSNSTLTVSGWGFNNRSEMYYARHLQIVTVPAFPSVDCNSKYYPNYYNDRIFQNSSLCGFDWRTEGLNGPCFGDVGAPAAAIHPETGVLYLAGVFSWTERGCGQQQYPSVYTKISAYLPWIKDNSSPYEHSP